MAETLRIWTWIAGLVLAGIVLAWPGSVDAEEPIVGERFRCWNTNYEVSKVIQEWHGGQRVHMFVLREAVAYNVTELQLREDGYYILSNSVSSSIPWPDDFDPLRVAGDASVYWTHNWEGEVLIADDPPSASDLRKEAGRRAEEVTSLTEAGQFAGGLEAFWENARKIEEVSRAITWWLRTESADYQISTFRAQCAPVDAPPITFHEPVWVPEEVTDWHGYGVLVEDPTDAPELP